MALLRFMQRWRLERDGIVGKEEGFASVCVCVEEGSVEGKSVVWNVGGDEIKLS